MVFQSLIESYGDMMHNNLNMSRLGIDQAYLIITNLRNRSFYVYSVYEECKRCLYFNYVDYLRNNSTRTIDTKHTMFYKVFKHIPVLSSDRAVCYIDTVFKEYGVYNLIIGKENCTVKVLKEPVNTYLPIFTVFIIYTFIFAVVYIFKLAIRKLSLLENSKEVERREDSDSAATFERTRLKSLDVFRGIIITLMIFVNYGGGGYNCILHVPWFGLHLADLLFPCFIWIMGLCIPLAMQSRLKKHDSIARTLYHIFKRFVLLFLFGMALASPLDLTKFTLFGPLQRLGICYLFHAVVCFIVMKKKIYYGSDILNEKLPYIVRLELTWFLIIIIMIIHTVVVLTVPFQNCSSGYFGPGGHYDDGKHFSCTGGITGHIDRVVLGKHIRQYCRAQKIFASKKYDPEGLLGTLPALAQACFGVQAGFILLTYKNHKNRVTHWLIWGVITGLAGGALCNFSWSGGIIPLCKQLWTASFMLVTCGFAFIAFTLCYVIVDVKKIWDGKPFIYPGMNSITMFIGHYKTEGQLPFDWTIELHRSHFMRLLANVTGTMLWILIAYYMYRKKLFVKI